MSLAVVVGVGLVGGAGAIARFALDGALAAQIPRPFPYGTFAVNLLGAFALGVVVGRHGVRSQTERFTSLTPSTR
jgi:fluoride exporter